MKRKNKKSKSNALTAAHKRSLRKRFEREPQLAYCSQAQTKEHLRILEENMENVRRFSSSSQSQPVRIDTSTGTHVVFPLTMFTSGDRFAQCYAREDTGEPLVSREGFAQIVKPALAESARRFYDTHSCSNLKCIRAENWGNEVTFFFPVRLQAAVNTVFFSKEPHLAETFIKCLMIGELQLLELVLNRAEPELRQAS